MYNYYNPYALNYGQPQQVVHVNGRAGAEAYQIMPNSSAILVDENEPLVWFIQTDGAGYKTITPYTVTPYQQETHDYGSLEERIKRIEEKLYESNTSETQSC